MTGSDAPWVSPPAICSCDYNVVQKTQDEWQHPEGRVIIFVCPVDPTAAPVTIADNQLLPLTTSITVGPSTTFGTLCQIKKNGYTYGGATALEFELTPEQLTACRDSLIEYGIALKSALAETDVTFNDLCTPSL